MSDMNSNVDGLWFAVTRNFFDGNYPKWPRTLAIALAIIGVLVGIGVIWLGILIVLAAVGMFVYFFVKKKRSGANQSAYHEVVAQCAEKVYPEAMAKNKCVPGKERVLESFTLKGFSYEDDENTRKIKEELGDPTLASDLCSVQHYFLTKETLYIYECLFSLYYGTSNENTYKIKLSDISDADTDISSIEYDEHSANACYFNIYTNRGDYKFASRYDEMDKARELAYKLKFPSERAQ